jgi:hypothetical protein
MMTRGYFIGRLGAALIVLAIVGIWKAVAALVAWITG